MTRRDQSKRRPPSKLILCVSSVFSCGLEFSDEASMRARTMSSAAVGAGERLTTAGPSASRWSRYFDGHQASRAVSIAAAARRHYAPQVPCDGGGGGEIRTPTPFGTFSQAIQAGPLGDPWLGRERNPPNYVAEIGPFGPIRPIGRALLRHSNRVSSGHGRTAYVSPPTDSSRS